MNKMDIVSLDEIQRGGGRGQVPLELYLVACFAVLGGGLFGLDIGVVGSVLDMDGFKQFRINVWEFGLISSGMNIGALLFCGFSGPLAERFGRRDTIGFAALFFTAFALLQGSADSFTTLFIGRVLSGGTIALCATVCPVYVSEIAPANRRGMLVSLQQTAIGFSIMLIYWLAWVMKGHCGANGSIWEDWRLCFYISGVPAFILGVGIWHLPRSPRWLVGRGRDADARASLARIRHPDEVSADLVALTRAVAQERERGQATCHELHCGRHGSIRRIAAAAFFVQLFQQIQGINIIMYFGPIVVDGFGLDGNLFMGIVQICNFGFTFFAVMFVDCLGRRPLLLAGTAVMFASLVVIGTIGVVSAELGEDGNYVLHNKAGGMVCVLCFVTYLAAFAATWGPIGWLIPSEIFPLRHRSHGMVLAAYANWSSNALLGLTFPAMLGTLGFSSYFVFAANCALAALFVTFMLPETKGVPLERMEALFTGHGSTSYREVFEGDPKGTISNVCSDEHEGVELGALDA